MQSVAGFSNMLLHRHCACLFMHFHQQPRLTRGLHNKNQQPSPACCWCHCCAAAGLRAVIIKLFPKSVLMAGAAGIGVFIAFVGMKVRPCAGARH
jgi:hypothetical protein